MKNSFSIRILNLYWKSLDYQDLILTITIVVIKNSFTLTITELMEVNYHMLMQEEISIKYQKKFNKKFIMLKRKVMVEYVLMKITREFMILLKLTSSEMKLLWLLLHWEKISTVLLKEMLLIESELDVELLETMPLIISKLSNSLKKMKMEQLLMDLSKEIQELLKDTSKISLLLELLKFLLNSGVLINKILISKLLEKNLELPLGIVEENKLMKSDAVNISTITNKVKSELILKIS